MLRRAFSRSNNVSKSSPAILAKVASSSASMGISAPRPFDNWRHNVTRFLSTNTLAKLGTATSTQLKRNEIISKGSTVHKVGQTEIFVLGTLSASSNAIQVCFVTKGKFVKGKDESSVQTLLVPIKSNEMNVLLKEEKKQSQGTITKTPDNTKILTSLIERAVNTLIDQQAPGADAEKKAKLKQELGLTNQHTDTAITLVPRDSILAEAPVGNRMNCVLTNGNLLYAKGGMVTPSAIQITNEEIADLNTTDITERTTTERHLIERLAALQGKALSAQATAVFSNIASLVNELEVNTTKLEALIGSKSDSRTHTINNAIPILLRERSNMLQKLLRQLKTNQDLVYSINEQGEAVTLGQLYSHPVQASKSAPAKAILAELEEDILKTSTLLAVYLAPDIEPDDIYSHNLTQLCSSKLREAIAKSADITSPIHTQILDSQLIDRINQSFSKKTTVAELALLLQPLKLELPETTLKEIIRHNERTTKSSKELAKSTQNWVQGQINLAERYITQLVKLNKNVDVTEIDALCAAVENPNLSAEEKIELSKNLDSKLQNYLEELTNAHDRVRLHVTPLTSKISHIITSINKFGGEHARLSDAMQKHYAAAHRSIITTTEPYIITTAITAYEAQIAKLKRAKALLATHSTATKTVDLVDDIAATSTRERSISTESSMAELTDNDEVTHSRSSSVSSDTAAELSDIESGMAELTDSDEATHSRSSSVSSDTAIELSDDETTESLSRQRSDTEVSVDEDDDTLPELELHSPSFSRSSSLAASSIPEIEADDDLPMLASVARTRANSIASDMDVVETRSRSHSMIDNQETRARSVSVHSREDSVIAKLNTLLETDPSTQALSATEAFVAIQNLTKIKTHLEQDPKLLNQAADATSPQELLAQLNNRHNQYIDIWLTAEPTAQRIFQTFEQFADRLNTLVSMSIEKALTQVQRLSIKALELAEGFKWVENILNGYNTPYNRFVIQLRQFNVLQPRLLQLNKNLQLRLDTEINELLAFDTKATLDSNAYQQTIERLQQLQAFFAGENPVMVDKLQKQQENLLNKMQVALQQDLRQSAISLQQVSDELANIKEHLASNNSNNTNRSMLVAFKKLSEKIEAIQAKLVSKQNFMLSMWSLGDFAEINKELAALQEQANKQLKTIAEVQHQDIKQSFERLLGTEPDNSRRIASQRIKINNSLLSRDFDAKSRPTEPREQVEYAIGIAKIICKLDKEISRLQQHREDFESLLKTLHSDPLLAAKYADEIQRCDKILDRDLKVDELAKTQALLADHKHWLTNNPLLHSSAMRNNVLEFGRDELPKLENYAIKLQENPLAVLGDLTKIQSKIQILSHQRALVTILLLKDPSNVELVDINKRIEQQLAVREQFLVAIKTKQSTGHDIGVNRQHSSSLSFRPGNVPNSPRNSATETETSSAAAKKGTLSQAMRILMLR